MKNNRKGKKRRSDEADSTKLIKQSKLDLSKKIKTKKIRENKEGFPKREVGLKGRKPRNRQPQNSDDEDEEKCASSTCIQPLGEEVHWIQCDGGCELWFHMACVGLSQKDINEDDDYICIACSRGNCKDALQSPDEGICELANEDSSPDAGEIEI